MYMNCKDCKKTIDCNPKKWYNGATHKTGGSTKMEENNETNEMLMMPVTAHDLDMARAERDRKRWFIAWIITFALFVITNGCWIWYNSQMEITETTVTQDIDSGDGGAYVAGVGDVYYGSNPSDGESSQQNP